MNANANSISVSSASSQSGSRGVQLQKTPNTLYQPKPGQPVLGPAPPPTVRPLRPVRASTGKILALLLLVVLLAWGGWQFLRLPLLQPVADTERPLRQAGSERQRQAAEAHREVEVTPAETERLRRDQLTRQQQVEEARRRAEEDQRAAELARRQAAADRRAAEDARHQAEVMRAAEEQARQEAVERAWREQTERLRQEEAERQRREQAERWQQEQGAREQNQRLFRVRAVFNISDDNIPSTWTTGSCYNPSKTYQADISGGNLRWRSGDGNVDIESIGSSGPNGLVTTTMRSDHVTGNNEVVGTTWTYRPSQGNTIFVASSNGVRFRLTRCP